MDRVFSPMAGKFIGSLSEVYLCAGAMFFRFVLFAWLCQWNVCENSSSKGWPAVYLCTGAVFFHSASFVYGLSTTCHAKRCFFLLSGDYCRAAPRYMYASNSNCIPRGGVGNFETQYELSQRPIQCLHVRFCALLRIIIFHVWMRQVTCRRTL